MRRLLFFVIPFCLSTASATEPESAGHALDSALDEMSERIETLEATVLFHHGVTADPGTTDTALVIASGDSTVYTVPAVFAGHYNAATTLDPYGFGFRFTIDDVSAGTTYLVGASPSGSAVAQIHVATDGRLFAEVLAKAVGNTKSGMSAAGVIQSGVEYFVDLRSESVSVGKRNASMRVGGATLALTSTGNGLVNGDTRPIRVGGAQSRTVLGCSMSDFYAFLSRPSDTTVAELAGLRGQAFRDAVTAAGGVNLDATAP